jgi:DNA ligase-1
MNYEVKLFGLNKNGTYKVWNIGAFHVHGGDLDKDGAGFTITHGQEGGKLTSKTEYVNEGKQGRTPYEQAVFQCESRVKTQLDKNYRTTKEELDDLPILAMLASNHQKDGKEELVEEGVYVSDKLDGIRCLAFCKLVQGVKQVLLKTRTGQDHSVPHIEAELLTIMEVGDILDGELYVHGPVLQDINSAVKRTDPEKKLEAAIKAHKKAIGTDKEEKKAAEVEQAQLILEIRPKLEFRVFDIIEFDVPFAQRLNNLTAYSAKFKQGGKVVLVPYGFANCMDSLRKLHKDAVSRGYEGIMYRTSHGEYESGKRSTELWKYKEMIDEEFRINGTTKDKQGYVVFTMQNNITDNEFNCVLGDYSWRLAVADDDFAGQYMTVSFQSRYKKTLKPQFPAGKLIRECDADGKPLE